MEILIKIDERYKGAKKLVEFLKTLPFVKFKKIKRKLSKEDEALLKIMKESEKSGYLTEEETEKLLNNL